MTLNVIITYWKLQPQEDKVIYLSKLLLVNSYFYCINQCTICINSTYHFLKHLQLDISLMQALSVTDVFVNVCMEFSFSCRCGGGRGGGGLLMLKSTGFWNLPNWQAWMWTEQVGSSALLMWLHASESKPSLLHEEAIYLRCCIFQSKGSNEAIFKLRRGCGKGGARVSG